MNHLFTLNPNLDLLNKYGYEFLPEFELQSIWTTEERIRVQNGFTALTNEFNVAEHNDTLLYISLVESNDADEKLQHRHYDYELHNRVKELAKLLLLFNPQEKHQPTSLKASSLIETVKLTDKKLIDRIGKTLIDAMESQEFNSPMLSDKFIDMTSNEDGEIIGGKQKLNYDKVRYYADQKIRKPGVRDRNRYLTNFLFRVWDFLDKETSLTTSPGVRFADSQLIFLFEIAELLGWLESLNISSEPKDYLSALFTNRLSQSAV